MSAVAIHEETFGRVSDNIYLARLAMECADERKNPDMLCGIIRVLVGHEAVSLVDIKKLSRPGLNFFREQFVRATTISLPVAT